MFIFQQFYIIQGNIFSGEKRGFQKQLTYNQIYREHPDIHGESGQWAWLIKSPMRLKTHFHPLYVDYSHLLFDTFLGYVF